MCQQCELNHEDPKQRKNVKVNSTFENKKSEEDIKKLHSTLGHDGITKMISYLKKVDSIFDKTGYTYPDTRESYELLIKEFEKYLTININ